MSDAKVKRHFYTTDKIRKIGAVYNMILGERSAGKTYDMLYHILSDYWEGRQRDELVQAIYIRRTDTTLKDRGTSTTADCLKCNAYGVNVIEEITGGEYDTIIYKQRAWWLAKKEGDLWRYAADPFMIAIALNVYVNGKGGAFPYAKTVWFEEFIEPVSGGYGYLRGEFAAFAQVVSTITRHRTDVTIWLTGNTLDPFCPYFEEMGIDRILEQKPGTIDVYKLGNTGRKIAVEMTKPAADSQASNSFYFAFNRPELKMIYEGGWAIGAYPILDRDLTREEIAGRAFVIFKGHTLELDVISSDRERFIYVHRSIDKLDPPDMDEDLIYSQEYDRRENHRRRIQYRMSKAEDVIWSLLESDRVYYDGNVTGNILDAYRNWSMRGD